MGKRELIQEQLIILAEAFGLEVSPTRQKIYCEALKDLSPDTVKRAVIYLIQTRKYSNLPTVAEIREAAEGSLDDASLLAWQKLNYAIDYAGYGNSVCFDDPKIMGAIVIWAGSWRKLRELDWTHEGMVWRQKEFVQAYKAAARCQVQIPEYFPGDYEMENEAKGLLEFIPKLKLIAGQIGALKMLETEGGQKRIGKAEVDRLPF